MCFVNELIFTLFTVAINLHQCGAEINLPFQTRTAQQLRTIRIKCKVEGEHFIAWETPSSINITQDLQKYGRLRLENDTDYYYTLVIQDVVVEDGGNYTCKGSEQSKSFTLEVDFASHGIKTPQRLIHGQNGTIQLELSAYPPLKYHWTKDGKDLILPTDGKVLDPYSGSINITRVGRNDAGNYTCRAVWKEGRPTETEDSVEIEVLVVANPSDDISSAGTSLLPQISSSISKVIPSENQLSHTVTTNNSSRGLPNQSIRESTTLHLEPSSHMVLSSPPAIGPNRTLSVVASVGLMTSKSVLKIDVASTNDTDETVTATIYGTPFMESVKSSIHVVNTTLTSVSTLTSPTIQNRSMVFNASQQSATATEHGTLVKESVKSSVHVVNATLATTFPTSNATITATIQTQSVGLKSTQQTATVLSSKLPAVNQSVSNTLVMSPSSGFKPTLMLMSSRSSMVQIVPMLPSSVVLEGNLSLSTVQDERSSPVLSKNTTSHSSLGLLSSTSGSASSLVASKDTTVQSSMIVPYNTSTFSTAPVSPKKSSSKDEFVVTSYATPCYIYYVVEKTALPVATANHTAAPSTPTTPKITLEIGSASKMQSRLPTVTLTHSSAMTTQAQSQASVSTDKVITTTRLVGMTTKSTERTSTKLTSEASPSDTGAIPTSTPGKIANTVSLTSPSVVTVATPNSTLKDKSIAMSSETFIGASSNKTLGTSSPTPSVSSTLPVASVSMTKMVGINFTSSVESQAVLPTAASSLPSGNSTFTRTVTAFSQNISVDYSSSTAQSIGVFVSPSKSGAEVMSIYTSQHATLSLSKSGSSSTYMGTSSHRKAVSSPSRQINITGFSDVLEISATGFTKFPSLTASGNLLSVASNRTLFNNITSTPVYIGSAISSSQTETLSTKHRDLNSSITISNSRSMGKSFSLVEDNTTASTTVEKILFSSEIHRPSNASSSVGASQPFVGIGSIIGIKSVLIIFPTMTPSQLGGVTLATSSSSQVLASTSVLLVDSTSSAGQQVLSSSSAILEASAPILPVDKRRKKRAADDFGFSTSDGQSSSSLTLTNSVTATVASTSQLSGQAASIVLSSPKTSQTLLKANSSSQSAEGGSTIPSSDMYLPSYTSTSVRAPQSFVGIGSIVGIKSVLIIFPTTTSSQLGGVTLASIRSTQVVLPQSVSPGNSSTPVGTSNSLPPENSTSNVSIVAASPSSSHASLQQSASNGSVPTSALVSPSSATNSFHLLRSETGNNTGSHTVMALRSLSSVYNGNLPSTLSLDLNMSSSAKLENTSYMEGHSFTGVPSIIRNLSVISMAISSTVADFDKNSLTLSLDLKPSATATSINSTSSLISTFGVDKTLSSNYISDTRTSSAVAGVSHPSSVLGHATVAASSSKSFMVVVPSPSLTSLERSLTQQPLNASLTFSSPSTVGSFSVTIASSLTDLPKNATDSSVSSKVPSSISLPSETVGAFSSSLKSLVSPSVAKSSTVISSSMTMATSSRIYKPPLVTISSLGMCYIVYTTRIVQPTLVTTQSFNVSPTATVNVSFTSGFLANATTRRMSTTVSLNISTSVVVHPSLQVNVTSTQSSQMDLPTSMFSNFTVKPSSTSAVVFGNSSVPSINTTTSRAVSTVTKSSSVSETLNVTRSVSKGTSHVVSVVSTTQTSVEKTAISTSSFHPKSPSVVGTEMLSSSTPPSTSQVISPTSAASKVVSSSAAVPTPKPPNPSLLLETIVKVPNDRDIQSPEFKSELEENLAEAYSFSLVTSRRKRRATPEINVTIDNIERVNNGEDVNVTFFVSQGDRQVPASEAAQAYQKLTKAELRNFVKFEVVNMPEVLVVPPTTSPPSHILVSLIIASSASENISAPANKKKLEDNLAAYYRKQKQFTTLVTATITTIIHEPNNIVYLEFYISVDGTPVNATDVVETFKVPHVNLLNTDLEVEVLVQVYIPDSLTATEADYVIIGVSVAESVDLANASFRSDLASKLATVYQNGKGKINSRRKRRSRSTSATIKDTVRKTDSQASEVDVTFFVFDSGKVVNSSYVVSVMNRLSTSQMTSLTRPYAIITAPRQAVVLTTEIPPTVASTQHTWLIFVAVFCPIVLIIILLLICWRLKKGAPTSKVDPHRIEMLDRDKRMPVHGYDVVRHNEPGVSAGMKTTPFTTRSPSSAADDEEAEAKPRRRETSLRRKVPKRPIQKLPVREQRQTNPAFEEEEEEEEEESEDSPVSVAGSTEALTKGRTSAKPPPVSRQYPPAQPQRPIERSELDSEEDSQLSEEESESEPESVAPPEKPSHSPGQIPTVAVMSEASGPPRYPPVRFRSSVHPAPNLPPLDPKRTSLVGVKVEPPSEDDSTRGRRKGKAKRRELEQRAALERQKNKQRLRERKRNDSRGSSAVVSERRAWDRAQHDIDDALGDDDAERVITGKKRRPRRKRPPSSSVATDEEGVPHLKSYRKLKSPKTVSSTSTQDRDKKRGKPADSASNPSSEEESEIDMNETRRRMHAMLDDAFSLFGPQLAKKPDKVPEGHPSHPAPQPPQVYTSTPARPAVIPRYIGGQPALPEPPPAHGRATEPTPGQRKRVQPTMPGYPVGMPQTPLGMPQTPLGMPQTPLGMPGYPGRPPLRPVVTRDPIVVWDPADRQRILNQRAPPPTYAYRDPSGQNVYITPVQQQRSDLGGLVWSPYAAEDSMDALYPDLAQASYPGALGSSPPKDTSFLSHLQAMPPHDTVLNMSAHGTFDKQGSTLGQSPQPLIKSIKDELFRLSQGASRKTPITEL